MDQHRLGTDVGLPCVSLWAREMESFLATSNHPRATNPSDLAHAARVAHAEKVVFRSDVMLRLRREVKENSPVYLHQRLEEGFRQLLLEVDLEPGDKLPTYVQMAAFLHVSIPMVRDAMLRLADEGLVAHVRSRGIFVL